MKERIQKLIEKFYADSNTDVTGYAPSPEKLAEFIDNGLCTHECGCGNIANGYDEDILCDECKELYGHSFASEL